MKRRLLSAFLAVMMVLTMAPVAFAADEDAENTAGDTGSSEVVSAVAKIGDTDYATLQAAVDAAKADDTITLLKDITVDGTDKATSRTVIDKPITLDLNDKTIKSPDNMGNNNKNFAALYISADVMINATTGGINTGTNGAYAIDVMNGATLTINGGNYYGGGTAVQVEKGTANINGGTFACEPYSNPTYGYKFLINCIDSAYKNGTAKVSIKGGSFVNFDPSDSASENPKGNFCASGYVAVKGATEDATVWTVEDHRVAEVGNTGYSTLADAVAAAQSGETVKLLANIAEGATIPADKTVTFDLNGKNIKPTTGDAIVNKGNLTIVGSGEVAAQNGGSAAIANFPDATANVKGGTFVSAYWYVIKNLGNMTIDGPVTIKKPEGNTDTSSLIDNGWYGSTDKVAGESVSAQADKAKLTIKSGKFTGKSGSASCSVIKNDDYATLDISGGTFDSTNNQNTSNATTILNWNVATISGGTFIGQYPLANGAYNNAADKGQFTISGGTFTGLQSLFGYGQGGDGVGKITITDGNFAAPAFGDWGSAYTMEISGGYFTVDPSAYCVTGKTGVTSDKDGYKYKVGTVEVKDENEIQTGAKVGDTKADASAIAEDKRPAAKAVGASVTSTTLTDTTPITADDKAQALTELVKNKKVTLNQDGTIPQDTTVTVVKKTYLDVTVTAYDTTSDTVSMDIVPKYDLIAVAKNGNSAAEQIVLKSAQDAKVGSTKVKVTLPDAFKGQKVYINHDNKELYVAKAKADGTVEFTTNGFSPFTFALSNPNVVAEVNGNAYKSLKEAIDAAQTGATIVLQKDCTEKVTVAGKSLTINRNGKTFNEANVTVGSNCTKEVKNDTIVVTYTKPSSGGSSGGSSSGKTTYKVTTSAVNNGGVNASPSNAEKGATITITLSPDKGYKLDKLTVTDGSGKTVSTVKKSDTVYTFTMPASAVKVGVSYVKATETPSKTKFNDVSANDWFASAVDYVTGKGMMNGTADNTFSPKANTTRGMVVTVLYRLENQPSTSAASFTDVASGAYYANAVAWANANGIVSGYGSGKFGPNDKVTREQLAAILYRYAQYKKYDVSVGEDTNILSYNDAQSISSYAIPAIQWACGAGVVTGKSGSKLDPKGNATRAEVAVMLMRFCENVK